MGKNLSRFLLSATTPQCDKMHTKIISATTPQCDKMHTKIISATTPQCDKMHTKIISATTPPYAKSAYTKHAYESVIPRRSHTSTRCLDRSGQIRPVAMKVSYGLTPGTVCRFVTSPSELR